MAAAAIGSGALTDPACRLTGMLAVAHRAGNSLAGLCAALDAGVDLVEADVYRFDRELEIRHARALGRHLLRERWRVRRRRGMAPPMLADLLTALGEPDGARLMLDLKGTSVTMAAQVAAVLRELAPGWPVTVCTKVWPMLDAFAADPHVHCVLSVSNRVQLGRLPAGLRRYPASGVSIRQRLLTPALVERLHDATGVVMVWPVDTAAALERARRLGVSGIISKNMALLRQVAAAR